MAFEEISVKLKAKSEVSNNNGEIANRESEINLLKLELGENVFTCFTNGKLDEGAIKDYCAKISKKLEEIDVLKDNISRIESERDAKLSDIRALKQAAKNAEKETAKAAAAPPAPPVCPQCGAPYIAGNKFCGECGAKLIPETEEN